MSLSHSPSIVRTGLVLCLDAANPKSYPGTGATWTDIAQKITFSSFGTQTPLETIGGAQSFAFNNSGYWQSDSGHENVDLGGDCTLLMWVYCEDVTIRRTVFEKAGIEYLSYQHEIAVTWEPAERFSFYSRYAPNYDFGGQAMPVIAQNAWSLVGIKMTTGKTAAARTGFYSINGSPWVSDYTSRSTTALLPAGALRVGTGYAGAMINGNVAMVMCYEKTLTDAEIAQNFEAHRSRFGI